MPFAPGDRQLARWERAALVGWGLFLLAFLALVEIRSAFLTSNRKTDLGVYLRAGWAVRTGADLYRVTCDNGWHYVYPPAFAVLMAPLADAPKGEPRVWMLPYSVTVALWTLFNVMLVGWSVHTFARLVLPDAARGSRRWWYARTVPVIVCLGGVGFTISHGQVNVLVVALAAGAFAASAAGRATGSGGWLAAAITLKVIPGLLLLYPLVRREYRAARGLAVGLLAGLIVVPLVGLGFGGTEAAYRSFLGRVLLPGATSAENAGMGGELTNVAATDSQSFLSAIHNNQYPVRWQQPPTASAQTRFAHWGIVGLLTVAACGVATRRGTTEPADRLIFLGLLTLIMLHATPVSHMHYYAFGLPLVAGLWLKGLADKPGEVWPGWRATLPLAAWGIATALPLMDGPVFELLRHRGFGPAASVVLITVGVGRLGRPAGALESTGRILLPADIHRRAA
ncbi:MAG TPA: glycosyltransferase family 87 protein [Gemmataceae bacterium]|nr:glycosyltransferase family 87 protein [Gemmataceae bacterium]